MLQISRDEYASEKERTNSLDNKANIFMSAIIAVITIFIPIIPFSKIPEIYISSSKIQIVIATLILSILTSAIGLLIKAFSLLYSSFQLKNYACINIENLNDDYILRQDINISEKGLIEHYNSILKTNIEINNEKAEKIVIGLKYSAISFALLCASSIGLIVLIGG